MKFEREHYHHVQPETSPVPFVLSIPHCGMEFPSGLVEQYHPSLLKTLDDTDFYLDRLYDFAPRLGVTVIYAKYSRWVIDLNREPGSAPLYHDGRLITGLCPTTDFFGNDLYSEKKYEPDDEEKERRLNEYFHPYHRKIDEIISELKAEFGRVVFWDGHSIRRNLPMIDSDPFPDFILGNNDGKTADPDIIDTALDSLRSGRWDVRHNEIFRGGYLTRTKGAPESGVHALQLEMSKDLYMSNDETEYDESKAKDVKSQLKATFENMIAKL